MAEQAHAPRTAAAELPGADEALAWVGFKLDEIGGAATGRIEGVMVDAADGSPSWLVIRIGRFGRRTAVPFDLAAAGVDRIWVPYSRETIRSSPEIDPAQGLTPALERELCAHYGIPPQVRRMAALEGREEEQASSLPAAA
jgi:hypothetical protein